VRACVVTGMFQRRVTSPRVRVAERWMVIPGRLARPLGAGTVTSTLRGFAEEIFQRAAALR
jgi:hypothetical protein